MTRFDIPAAVQNVLNVASQHRVLDAADLVALGATHRNNWRALLAEVVDASFSGHHDPRGRKAHAAVCRATDAAHAALDTTR